MALKAVRVMAVVAVLLAAVLIVWFTVIPHKADVSGQEQPQSGSPSPSQEQPQSHTLPALVDELSVACDGPGQAYPAAPAYAGPPPHPIAVFDGGQQVLDIGKAASTQYRPDDPRSVQLLGCVSAKGGLPDPAHPCDYGFPGTAQSFTTPVTQEQYEIDIYDLRTHHKVAGTTVVGAGDTCPPSAFRTQVIYSTLTTAQYHALLDPYVMASI